ncbi:ROK family transcriptional regulator [Lentzea californiensis]|uniref:ROK family transcriptional regulator n=1 Tax=Lentzea californiensis TaxID=438851 RepID=UPI00216635AF|nr:ROK family transcriptional regulator [Lentzea californiensis]MCR3750288.1 Sugar kinase of the NBD/HSP70 family, may containing an N-terminal HTH domain [Lentzea californiensis]
MSAAASVVLGAVLRHGPIARSALARACGLSPAAVTRACAALSDLGLLVEVPEAVPYQGIGRPHVPVDIDTTRHVVAGIHVAHLHCTLTLVDLRGGVLVRREIPHGTPDDPHEVLTTAADQLLALHAERLPGHIPIGLGVAAGGWVDPAHGVIVRHASLGWRDTEVRDLLTARTGLPVRVDSHARALARAEQLFGAARGRESLLHLFVGNVVGAAIVTGGAAHLGPRAAAGDVAHLALGDPAVTCACGKRGCLEATVSDRAWATRAFRAGVISRPLIFDLVDAALAGSAEAKANLAERARLVGRAAAVLFDFLDPEVLVVTELGTNRLPSCAAALRDEVAAMSRASGDVVLASSFGEDVLAVAAGAVQLDALYADPLSIRNPVWQGV